MGGKINLLIPLWLRGSLGGNKVDKNSGLLSLFPFDSYDYDYATWLRQLHSLLKLVA